MDSISIREAADRLAVSQKVIRRLISQGTLEAYKHPGAHGAEWRVEIASLSAYQSGQSPARHGTPTRVRLPVTQSPNPNQSELADPDSWCADKAFLQDQVIRLTEMLGTSLSSGRLAHTAEIAVPDSGAQPLPDVTTALQSSLRSVAEADITGIELCSVRVLWGSPVLWRVEATAAEDIQSLRSAVLSEEATWMPPGEEVVFIWALGANREVLWGTACGPGWFGPAFEETLRGCRVERR